MLIGHGRVGSYITEALAKSGLPLLVIDSEARNVAGRVNAASRRSPAMAPIRR